MTVAETHATAQPGTPAATQPDLGPAEERGRTTIADKVVERIAAIAAGEVEAVTDPRQGWTRMVRGGLPKTWPTPLSGVAARVRDHVSDRGSALAGVTVTAVDVSIADVVHVETAHRRVQ